MAETPAVSVIIPAFNRAQYIGRAIESAIDQSFDDHEIIVVDDGSTDETAAVVARYPSVRYLYQANAGIGAARNCGIQAARGRFLTFLDSDDLWPRDKLMIQIRAMRENSQVDVLYGHARQFLSPQGSSGMKDPTHFVGAPVPGYLPGTMLATSDAFTRVGLFPTAWVVGEAMDWHLRAVEQGLRIMLLPEVLLFRRLHADNQGRQRRDARGDYVRILKASLDRRRASGSLTRNPRKTHDSEPRN